MEILFHFHQKFKLEKSRESEISFYQESLFSEK